MKTKLQKRQIRGEDDKRMHNSPACDKAWGDRMPLTGNLSRVDSLPTHSTARPLRQTAMLQMQQSHGNAYVQRMISNSERSGDIFENEPDSGVNSIANIFAAADGNDRLSQRIQTASAGGSRLYPDVQRWLEHGLSADLSNARIHTDREADDLARSVGATAFTTGQDIFFRNGAYNPASDDGLHLIAHEATHVVQQATGPMEGTPAWSGELSISRPSDRFEQEADFAASRVVAGETAQVQAPLTANVARDEDDSWWDTVTDIAGTVGGVAGMGGSLLESYAAPVSEMAGTAGSALGTAGNVLGLVTGIATLADTDRSLAERIMGGASATSGGIGLLGQVVPSLVAGGEAGLSATALGSGAMGSAGAWGTAGAALGSAGAVLGAGLAGYGVGTLIAENTGIDEAIGEGLFDLLGPGPGLWLADTFGL